MLQDAILFSEMDDCRFGPRGSIYCRTQKGIAGRTNRSTTPRKFRIWPILIYPNLILTFSTATCHWWWQKRRGGGKVEEGRPNLKTSREAGDHKDMGKETGAFNPCWNPPMEPSIVNTTEGTLKFSIATKNSIRGGKQPLYITHQWLEYVHSNWGHPWSWRVAVSRLTINQTFRCTYH